MAGLTRKVGTVFASNLPAGGSTGFVLLPDSGTRTDLQHFGQYTTLWDVTISGGTWTIEEWVYNRPTITLAALAQQITTLSGITTSGLKRLSLMVPFTTSRSAVCQPTHYRITRTDVGGTRQSFSADIYNIVSGQGTTMRKLGFFDTTVGTVETFFLLPTADLNVPTGGLSNIMVWLDIAATSGSVQYNSYTRLIPSGGRLRLTSITKAGAGFFGSQPFAYSDPMASPWPTEIGLVGLAGPQTTKFNIHAARAQDF